MTTSPSVRVVPFAFETSHVLSLRLHPALTDAQGDQVCAAVGAFQAPAAAVQAVR